MILSGRIEIFYRASDRQMEQWNLISPPLSLWSRPDWTDKHKAIAQENGHLFSLHEVSRMETFNNRNSSHPSHLMDGNFADDDMLVDERLVSTDDLEVQELVNDGQKEISMHGNAKREIEERNDYLMGKTSHGNVEQHSEERHEDHMRSPHENDERESQERHGNQIGKTPHGIVERESQERHDNRIRKIPYGSVERKSQERHDNRIAKRPHGNVERESQERHDYRMGKSPHGNVERESLERHKHRMGKTNTSWKMKHTEENNRRDVRVRSPAKSKAKNQTKGLPDRSQSNSKDGISSVESLLPKSVVSSPYSYGHSESMQYGAASSTLKSPSFANPLSDYVASHFEEHHSSLLIDGTNSLGYNPYVGEDDSYLREFEPRQQPRLYGLQDPISHYPTNNYLSGQDSVYGRMGSGYGVLGSGSESAYMMSTPAMQRYASRLDPLSHVRLDSFGSEPPPMIGRNTGYEHSVLQPEYGSGMPSDPPGFAGQPHNPYYPYSRPNSGGWFNG
ncbi:hypothetical protein PIB30_118213 [Stylosanthes scabra]|uniref:DM2 domain-containing protein n=1 Tax=Stylosanthes scabra TaxID=79078 RepID=A0ABU6R323_9FABA|nr:hypothetical protein [Stylosanthes scabra]